MSDDAGFKRLVCEVEAELSTIASIPQRVNQYGRHNGTVNRAKALVQRLKKSHDEACRAVANDVASRCADVDIWSSDGVCLRANRAALSSASPVLRATFNNGTVEGQTNTISMGFKGDALRIVLPMLHSPSLGVQVDDKVSFSSLLDACKLADSWELYQALDQLIAQAIHLNSNKPNSAVEWFKAMKMADQRCDILDTTDSSLKCWRSLWEAARKALACSEPANLMSASGLKQLDIKPVCQILSCVVQHKFKLPDVKLGELAHCRQVSGKGAAQADVDPFAIAQREMSLMAHMRRAVSEASMDGMKISAKLRSKVSVHVMATTKGDSEMSFVLGKATITIPALGSIARYAPLARSILTQERKLTKHGPFSFDADLDPSTHASWVAQAEFTVSKEQRRYELFNRWMLDRQVVTEPLSVLDSLAFLRASVSGIDPQQAAPKDIKAALQARGLPSGGSIDHQVVMLTDAIGEEMLKCDFARPIYESFARLIAADFESLREQKMTELCRLDVGALSLVLICDDVLWVKSEGTFESSRVAVALTHARAPRAFCLR